MTKTTNNFQFPSSFSFVRRLSRYLYPSNLEMLGSARLTWFVDAAAI